MRRQAPNGSPAKDDAARSATPRWTATANSSSGEVPSARPAVGSALLPVGGRRRPEELIEGAGRAQRRLDQLGVPAQVAGGLVGAARGQARGPAEQSQVGVAQQLEIPLGGFREGGRHG